MVNGSRRDTPTRCHCPCHLSLSKHNNTLTSHCSPSSVADAIDHIAERIVAKAAEQATRVIDMEADRTKKWAEDWQIDTAQQQADAPSSRSDPVQVRQLHVAVPYPAAVGAPTVGLAGSSWDGAAVQDHTAQWSTYDHSTGTEDREEQRKLDRQRNMLDRQRKCWACNLSSPHLSQESLIERDNPVLSVLRIQRSLINSS